jgi:hypothetical protein
MTKPVVNFYGDVQFFNYYDHNDPGVIKENMVAMVRTTNHPVWGRDKVRTSVVQKKFKDGSFETMNTLYKPLKEQS